MCICVLRFVSKAFGAYLFFFHSEGFARFEMVCVYVWKPCDKNTHKLLDIDDNIHYFH